MIDAELASFLQQGIAIQLGTRNDRLEPSGVRVVAARVEEDGQHLVVYVHAGAALQVVPDIESNGQVAIVFSRPPDERACQVKGIAVGVRVAGEDERAFVEGQWTRWIERLMSIGLQRPVFDHWPAWPCLAVRCRVNAIFSPTPGPGAGAPLA
jgi:general stress protein 26